MSHQWSVDKVVRVVKSEIFIGDVIGNCNYQIRSFLRKPDISCNFICS